MKARKIISILTAIALIVIPMQVAFAAGTEDMPVDGEGTVDYVNPATFINIVAPTANALDFTLDPQNLAATQGVGLWEPEDGGSIIPASVCTIANMSAVPIKTSVHLTFEDDKGDVVLLDSPDNVDDGLDKNMYLSFVPANAKTSIDQAEIPETTEPAFVKNGEEPVTFNGDELLAAGVESEDLLPAEDAGEALFGQFVETEDEGVYNQVEVPAHSVVNATVQTTVSEYTALAAGGAAAKLTDAEAGVDLAFDMKKAVHYVVRGAAGFSLVYDSITSNDNFDTASFIISGVINRNANWSGYDEETKISVKATYSFDVQTDAEYDAAIADKVDTTYNSLETVPPVAPAVTDETLAIEAGTAEDVAVTLGAGSLAATGITSVTYEDSGTQTLDVTDDYTFSGTTLTFTSAYIDSLIAAEVDSRTYTVTFNNTDATTDTVTLTYAPAEAPSISEETAEIEAGTAEDFTVSLGQGGLAATDIASVTYEDGSTHTLVADTDYTFADTTLTFTSAYVDSLIEDEVESRTFTVTFNDTDATTDTVELTYTLPPVTGAAPSIATTSYSFSSGNPVAITVDLGSGDLAATGIASMTYSSTTGDKPVDASSYTFAGNTLTFTSAYINSMISISVTNRVFTVKFNDSANTTVVVTLHRP